MMRRWIKPLLSTVSHPVTFRRLKSHRTYEKDMSISGLYLDRLDIRCEKIPPVPHPRIPKVTVLGAASDVGLISCLFLKQQNIIKTLAMFDEEPRNVIGYCHDLSHLDTSTAIEAYQSRLALPAALQDASVVLLCGGYYPEPPVCNISDHDLFYINARYVHTMTHYVAVNCPDAVLCIQVPPVDPMFNMCRHTLKSFGVYNKSFLLGMNSITAMRANQLLCEVAGTNPAGSYCPCVGGTCFCTRVPVFSTMRDYAKAKAKESQLAELPRFVREADILVCSVKNNYEQAHLSIGFATARTVVSVMNGLFGKGGTVDSALVEQANPAACYGMEICATPVGISKEGISSYIIPKLNPAEAEMLENAKWYLDEYLHLGECFALGEDYISPPCRLPYCKDLWEDCPQGAGKKSKKSAKN